MRPLKFLFYKKNSTFGEHAKVYPFTIVKKSSIGDFTYISYFCNINNSNIGKFCSIAQNVKIGLGIHPINFISTSPVFYSLNNPLGTSFSEKQKFEENKIVTIGHDVWIGANVTILDGVEIGTGSIIGANSVVTKNVEPYSIVGGVPAKEIKTRFSPEINEKLIESNWWSLPISFLKKSEVSEIFSNPLTTEKTNYLLELINQFNIEN